MKLHRVALALFRVWWRSLVYGFRLPASPLATWKRLSRVRSTTGGAVQLLAELHGQAGGLTVGSVGLAQGALHWRSPQPAPDEGAGLGRVTTLVSGLGSMTTRVERRALSISSLVEQHTDHLRQVLRPLRELQELQQTVRGLLSVLPLMGSLRAVVGVVRGEVPVVDLLAPVGLSLFVSVGLSVLAVTALRLWLRRLFARFA